MAALPYMQLYVADYLADTSHLNAAQHGAYLLLLMNYWQRGKPLRALDDRLASVARMSNEEWQRNKDVIAEFFEVTDSEWVHRRVESDLKAVLTKSEQASNAGKASAQRRRSGRSTDVTTDVTTNEQRTLNHRDTDKDTDKKREEEAAPTGTPTPSACGAAFSDASLVWRFFQDNTGLSGKWLGGTITDIAKLELKSSPMPEQVLAGIFATAWAEYNDADKAGKLATAKGPEGFFADGLWKDRHRWKWKKGYSPPVSMPTKSTDSHNDMEQAYLETLKGKIA